MNWSLPAFGGGAVSNIEFSSFSANIAITIFTVKVDGEDDHVDGVRLRLCTVAINRTIVEV
jgi:hypothetical protein